MMWMGYFFLVNLSFMGEKFQLQSKKLWCLLGVNLFENMNPSDMQELSQYTQNRKYQRKEIIYLPGDPSTTVYFLKKGRVKLVYLAQNGRKLTLAICRPGQPFGELTLGEEREYHRFFAQALEDVELCLISKDALIHFAQERPYLSLRLTKWIGQQLRELQNRLEDVMFRDVATRLACLLHRLAREDSRQTLDGVEINFKLTNLEIAELIGSTRETTTLLLNQLRRTGVIIKRRGRIIIQSPEVLRKQVSP
jgi:CRP/FNR family transcriptional regulator